ncbi:hypothetical protein Hamer_G010381 [Homarus americanus]|uniref:Uncharacterized protein n=1 Tax=Homarus americanus TaxID=6706 RepID=A0A8J5MWZ4_HOMAM|nr:hypothetical protein Hamer_G010381 [Homarus americanus]
MAQRMFRTTDEMDSMMSAIVDISTIEEKKISSFFNGQSNALFRILVLDDSFLLKTPDDWEADYAFQRANEVVMHLKVVNNLAERGVALVTEYNKLITADEEQKQYLLQVVADHRKQFPTPKKSALF